MEWYYADESDQQISFPEEDFEIDCPACRLQVTTKTGFGKQGC